MARKSGFIAGIIALLLAFMAHIPINPNDNLYFSFKVFTIKDVDFYFWGYIIGDFASSPFFYPPPENYFFISIWILIILIAIISIMASTKKAIFSNSNKLYSINILLLVLLILIVSIPLILANLTNILSIFLNMGFGYLLTLVVLILNIFAKKRLNSKGNS